MGSFLHNSLYGRTSTRHFAHVGMVAWLLLGTSCWGQVQDTSSASTVPEVGAVRIHDRIRIDGRLDEPAWEKAKVLGRFVQREPDEGAPVTERTEVRIAYDEKHLYVGFRCWDSEIGRIVANEMRRDIYLLNNDCVEIFLDTYNDGRTAFYFSTNALGAQRDGIIAADVSDEEQNWDWNGVWENASTIDSSGWTAEIAIPFQTLRFHPQEESSWGINVSRIIPRKREEAYWSPIQRKFGWNGRYRISAYGKLTGLRGLRQPGDFDLKPFLLAGVQRDFEASSSYEKKLNVGLDAKYHLTTNLTMDISLNTDFAQVESDQEQVNLTRFELFFPEKRDFFLESAAIFRFGERAWSPLQPTAVLFFSRRIGLSEDNTMVPLLGGVRITGKAGNSNIGFLNMLADQTDYTVDDTVHVHLPRTNFLVIRLRQDVLANSSVGLIGLNKQSLNDGTFNRGIGADANFYLSPSLQAGGLIARTFSPGVSDGDIAAYGDIMYNDDFWTFMVNQNSIGDNFNSEMGFIPRTGIRKTQINFGISPRPKIFSVRQLALFNDFYYITNQHGDLESRINYTGFFSLFESGASLFTILSLNHEQLSEDFEIHDGVTIVPGLYRFNNVLAMFESDKSKSLSGSLNATVGEFYDGTILGYGVGANMKLGTNLTVNLQYSRNDVRISAGSFQTDIVGTRLLYTFSPSLFAKAFVQWNGDEKVVIGNFLVNFIHTPGSDLFLVYNEELHAGGASYGTKNRTLMLKFTYLFQI